MEAREKYIKWLKERIETTKKEKDAIGTDTPDKLKQTAGKGGKLCAYKDVLAYILTHPDTSVKPQKEEGRKYDKAITKQTYGDLMTVEEWNQAVDEGWFITTDGSGYWVKDGKECDDEVFSSEPLDATHVMWYNK